MFEPIGLGTFRIQGKQMTQVVTDALEIGYRHIDTARMYGNEKDIGKSLQQSSLRQEQVWVTSKVWHENLEHYALLDSLRKSCDDLKRDFLDLALIHWPDTSGEVPLKESLDALQKAKQEGLIKHFGVSNFNRQLLKEAISHVGADNILTNQIEMHPFLANLPIANLCDQHDIRVTAYMPLAKGEVMNDPTLQQIAEDHDTNPAAISIAWLLQHKRTAIPSSTKLEHLRSNFDAQHLHLSPQQMHQIDSLDKGMRLIDPDFAPDWSS
ncbi:2,5-didehydrogluconate reductase B [Aliidiomarina sedimenti]|uniref:2,5-didehydrogluconate reductase B n=1 Tax=Aliidiomarina sedimenti TaxID=1933879 RepID=A0ABY0BZ88_9GAMM|nr:aldo/keto reductase [Aliidiomarina sedimenti]RUO30066.1 2,5-didehydrogluconate reductase B [Aliidiomarina sedimenti]